MKKVKGKKQSNSYSFQASMKEKVKFLLHFTIGLLTVLGSLIRRSQKAQTQMVIDVQTHHLNRYLLNALNLLQDNVTIQLHTSLRNLADIGELRRSKRLGSEILDYPQIIYLPKNVGNVALSIDYFQENVDNRLPIWRHPKFNKTWTQDSSKMNQVVFAGSHSNAYNEFDESLWLMPNRLKQIEFITEHITDIHIHHWMASNNDYAKLLANSSHFLCLPGYKMPLCHNLFEAIEFGCVPIVHISYHKWLEPALKNAITSFTYSTMDALSLLVDRIVSGQLRKETHSAQSKIKEWIDNEYALKDVLKSSIARGEIVICAEEDSVTIHENRSA